MNSVIKTDPNGDSNGSRNVVSDATHATTFIANDGTYLYFRLRLDDDPSGSGGQGALRSFGWGVEFDTNMDNTNYEWIILVDGISNPEVVKLAQNTVQTSVGDPSDSPEIVVATVPVGTSIDITTADTSFNGDQDYFLDWRFSVADFKAATGLTDSSPIRIFEGSSSSANTLTANGADYVGDDLPTGFSDFINLLGKPLTTGSVRYVNDLAGNGDMTQAAPGDTLFIRVDDADLNTATATVQTVTVIVTSPNGESETVTLTETGVNTGIFTGSLNTLQGAAAGANNDGVVVADNLDILTVTYNDATSSAGVAATVTDTLTILQPPANSSGTISATATINATQAVTITVTDSDMNLNPLIANTLTVTVQNQNNGESELVTLTETGVNTGIFTATLATVQGAAAGANNNGAMNVTAGDVLRSTYNEPSDAAGNPAVRTADTNVIDTSNFITITSPTGNQTTATHNVIGTTDPNSTVTMNDPINGNLLTTIADATGNYTFNNVTFPQGSTTYSVTSTDTSNNVATALATVYIDSTNFITITSPPNGSVINITTSNVTGTTDPDSTVTMVEPGTGNTLTVVADAAGNFTFPNVNFNMGLNTMNFTSTDPQGNVATTSSTVTVDLNIALNITSIVNGATYNTTTLPLAGTTDPNATVTTIHPTTGVLLTTTADAAGNYSFGNLVFPTGTQTQTVNATDPVGNAATTNVTFTIDTSNTNTITTTGTFTVSSVDVDGTTDPLSTVTFKHPVTGVTLTVTANAAGNYSFPNIFFPDGTHTLTTTSTDPQGNVAVDTSPITVITQNAINSNTPPDNSVVSTSPLTITGTTLPGSTVTMVDPVNGTTYITVADANGNFSFPAVNLAPGNNNISIVSTDPSGVSVTHTTNLIYDPNISVNVQNPVNNNVYQGSTHTVSGQTVPNATVTMPDPVTGAILTTVADAAGNYSFGNITFQDGTNNITVTADDGFGNNASTTISVIVAGTGVDANIQTSERTVFGNPIYIEVRDPETYLDSSRIDTLQVVVANPTTGDSEVRTLIETGINTGIFTGQLDTVESNVSDGSNTGTLAVLYGDTVTTSYVDVIKADGTLNTTILDTTLITNDGLLINVNLHTVSNGVQDQKALADTRISIIEYDSSGNLTGDVYNYTTSGAGVIPTEFIGRMQRNNTYRVLINDSVDGYPYSQSQEFTLADLENAPVDNRGVRTYTLVLDPAGFVYDALTGARIAGTDVTLYHDNNTQVVGPFSLFTQNPSTNQTNPQLSGSSGVAGGFEFIGSSAGSDLTAGFYYITVSFNTNPALGNTYIPVTLSSASWAGIQEPYTGQLFPVNIQNQPIGMRIPLYRIGQQNPLVIAKQSNKDQAAVGDIVTFTVSVQNQGNMQTDPSNPVVVRDTMPMGMSYVQGSAVLSTGAAITAFDRGRGVVEFSVGTLMAAGASNNNDTAIIYYQTVVDSSTRPGMILENQAVAMISRVVLSNTASVAVKVIEDPLFDQATLIGRVYHDSNHNSRFDKGEKGVGGAGLLIDDGTYVITDANGAYSVPGVKPGLASTGRKSVKLDMNTLPWGTEPTTDVSQFVIMKPGSLDKANFGVVFPPEMVASVNPVCDSDYLFSNKQCSKTDIKFISGMFDVALGTVDSGAGIDRSDMDIYPEGSYIKGRTALFIHKRKSNKYTMTLSYDSEKRHTSSLFNFIDPDLYYPTYGDNSTVRYLAQNQGKLYFSLNTSKSSFTVGNYQVDFDGTEIANISRSLSGVVFQHTEKLAAESEDSSIIRSELTVFSAKRKQKHAISELRSTGGAQYYLAHSKIVTGSDRITVQIRDQFTGESVIEEVELARGIDYEIDYYTGRLRLLKPVSRYADFTYLYNYSLLQGNPVWICATYMYDPNDTDLGTYGARLFQKTKWNFGLGLSYLYENYLSRDHHLSAMDFHLYNDNKEYFTIEYGKSQSNGVPVTQSHDGGRTFIQTDPENNESGSALSVNWLITQFDKLEWQNYYYDITPSFSGGTYLRNGLKRYGTSMIYGEESRHIAFEYSNIQSILNTDMQAALLSGGGLKRTYRFAFYDQGVKTKWIVEALHSYSSGSNYQSTLNTKNDTTDSLALRYEKKMTDRITFTATQQLTFYEQQNHQTRLGVVYKMNKKMNFTVETAAGTHGAGARFGFERDAGKGSTAFVSVSSGYSHEYGSRTTNTAAGISQEVTDNTSAFVQYGTTSTARENVSHRAVGINHWYEVGEGADMSLAFERSEDRSSLQGAYFTNSVSCSAQIIGKRELRLSTDMEYRQQQGDIRKEFWGHRMQFNRRLLHDLSLFAEYDYEVSEDLAAGFADSKFTKSLLGLAWRPTDTDRVNILGRTGRVREYRSLALNDALNPDTVSVVMSVEGLYDVSHDLTIRQKFALKSIKETIHPIPAARARSTLWISGLTWKPSPMWDLHAEYRTTHQPIQQNHRDGVAVDIGHTFKKSMRVGVGYNFSTYSDDEFQVQDNSFKGIFFLISGKL